MLAVSCKRCLVIPPADLSIAGNASPSLRSSPRKAPSKWNVSMSSAGRTMATNPRPSQQNMSRGSGSVFWPPSQGLRFTPRMDSKRLYPLLDFSRFLSVEARADSSKTIDQDSVDSHDAEKTSQSIVERFDTAVTVDPSPTSQGGKDDKDKQGPLKQESGEITSDGQEAVGRTSPPLTELEYNISSAAFYAARSSSAGSAGSFWSHTMYQRLMDDGALQNVKVHYCTSKHTMERVCQQHFLDEPVLGFDLEWETNVTSQAGPRANVALIQLASPGHIGLFHVARFQKDDFVAPSFREIMGNADITKTGVSIRADCTRLKNFLGVESRAIFELSHLYKLVKYSQEGRPGPINKILVSLSTQVQDYLGLPMFKGGSVRTTTWKRVLTMDKLICA